MEEHFGEHFGDAPAGLIKRSSGDPDLEHLLMVQPFIHDALDGVFDCSLEAGTGQQVLTPSVVIRHAGPSQLPVDWDLAQSYQAWLAGKRKGTQR